MFFFLYLNYMESFVVGSSFFLFAKRLVFYFDDLFIRPTDLNSFYSDSAVTVEFVIYLFLYP